MTSDCSLLTFQWQTPRTDPSAETAKTRNSRDTLARYLARGMELGHRWRCWGRETQRESVARRALVVKRTSPSPALDDYRDTVRCWTQYAYGTLQGAQLCRLTVFSKFKSNLAKKRILILS